MCALTKIQWLGLNGPASLGLINTCLFDTPFTVALYCFCMWTTWLFVAMMSLKLLLSRRIWWAISKWRIMDPCLLMQSGCLIKDQNSGCGERSRQWPRPLFWTTCLINFCNGWSLYGANQASQEGLQVTWQVLIEHLGPNSLELCLNMNFRSCFGN